MLSLRKRPNVNNKVIISSENRPRPSRGDDYNMMETEEGCVIERDAWHDAYYVFRP
jgi:hypothetical protein